MLDSGSPGVRKQGGQGNNEVRGTSHNMGPRLSGGGVLWRLQAISRERNTGARGNNAVRGKLTEAPAAVVVVVVLRRGWLLHVPVRSFGGTCTGALSPTEL